jgi:hypothetical protein
MVDEDREAEDMVILTVCTYYFGESSSSSSDESSEDHNVYKTLVRKKCTLYRFMLP